jgi:hypothetical protein
MTKAVHNIAPEYVCELVSTRHQSWMLQSSGSVRLQVCKTHTDLYGQWLVQCCGTSYLWGWHLAQTLLPSRPSWRLIFLGWSLIFCKVLWAEFLSLDTALHVYNFHYACMYVFCSRSKYPSLIPISAKTLKKGLTKMMTLHLKKPCVTRVKGS